MSRLYSLWTLKCANGLYEWTFDEALERDQELIETARYTHHLSQWYHVFGRAQVMAALFDDLKAAPQRLFR